MPKVFRPSIGSYFLGPMPDKPPPYFINDDVYWNARKSFSFTLKKYCYFRYVASFKVTASTTGFYKNEPVDIGDYCKNIITVTTSTQFRVTDVLSYKEKFGEDNNKNTIPPSIYELMCGYTNNNWFGKIQQKYRRSNALPPAPTGSNISDVTEKSRNCSKDYDDDGNKISENPDYSLFDYTVTFDSLLSVDIDYGYGDFLDDVNFTVQPSISFGSTYNHLDWVDNAEDFCAPFKTSGSLVFVGKTISSKVYGIGIACGKEGQINMQVTWSTSSKLKLVN